MARFTFNLRSGDGAVEVEQIDLPDAFAARREAVHACGDFLRELNDLGPADEWEMEVLDSAGKRICLLRFSGESFLLDGSVPCSADGHSKHH